LRSSQARVRSTTQWVGEDFEADGPLRTLDDFDGPLTKLAKRIVQFLAGISSVDERAAQPREQRMDGFGHQHGPVTILHIGAMNCGPDEEADGIGDDMAFATPSLRCGRSLTFLPARPPGRAEGPPEDMLRRADRHSRLS
jgi:hypothetical protein